MQEKLCGLQRKVVMMGHGLDQNLFIHLELLKLLLTGVA